MTVGLHYQADAGRSETEMYEAMIASNAQTHVVLNGPGLAARGLTAGRRIIYRRWKTEIFKGRDSNRGDDNADEWYDPIDFANRIHAEAPTGAIVALGNEMWCSNADQMKRMNDWTVKALRRCNELGRKAGIFSISVGNPPDPALWNHAREALQLARDGGHLLLLHEYWGLEHGDTDATSAKNKPWLIARYDLIPAHLPRPEIVITELGYALNAHQGYAGKLSDEEFARELIEVSRLYDADGIDSCIFVYGPKGGQWASFVPSERVLSLVAAYNRVAANQPHPPPETLPPTAPDTPLDPNGLWFLRPTGFKHIVSSPFGYRKDVEPHYHGGVDYIAADGEREPYKVIAPRAGVVEIARWTNDRSGLGYYARIKHTINGEEWRSWLGHLEDGSLKVREGDTVVAGQWIGNMGNTGNSTGRHLHWAVTNDRLGLDGYDLRKAVDVVAQKIPVLAQVPATPQPVPIPPTTPVPTPVPVPTPTPPNDALLALCSAADDAWQRVLELRRQRDEIMARLDAAVIDFEAKQRRVSEAMSAIRSEQRSAA